MITGTLLLTAAVAGGAVVLGRLVWVRAARERYIRTYRFPRGLFEKLARRRPSLDLKQQQLVARGLRQFFLAYLKGGRQRVAMPSQVADELWHEFILFTREYQLFCGKAFGEFLHHTPAVAMRHSRWDNEGLRRVWWQCCLEENIHPRKATRLPLLFALDHKLGIADGYHYDLDCQNARARGGERNADGGTQCASDFSDPDIDGTTDGFGDAGSSASDGDVGGCSGGCGGGD